MSGSKKIIDLRVLNEGMFSHFLSGVVGFILGKRSNNMVIKGKEKDIENLTRYLKQMRKSDAEKNALVDKLMSMQRSSANIQRLRDEFYSATGIRLP